MGADTEPRTLHFLSHLAGTGLENPKDYRLVRKRPQIPARPCELEIDFMSFFETVHSIGPKSDGARFGGSCMHFSEETLCRGGSEHAKT